MRFALFFLILVLGVQGKPWGLYQIYWGDDEAYLSNLQKEINVIGKIPNTLLLFRDLHYSFPQSLLQKVNRLYPQIDFVISLELHKWGERSAVSHLKAISRGEYDSFFIKYAQEMKYYKKTIYFRFGFEMNGSWFSWGEQPTDFKEAWRHVYHLFKEQGVRNIKWIFAPNVLWEKRNFKSDFLPYYPGDEFVDMVGLDGYNFGDRHDMYHTWSSYVEVFEASIDAISKWGKPLWITEIACADDERKGEWIKTFLDVYAKDQRIENFIWFQYDKREEGEPNWSLQSDSMSLFAFRNGVLGK